MLKQTLVSIFSAALAVSLAACSDDDGGTPDASAPTADAAATADAPPAPIDASVAPDAFMVVSMPSCDEITTTPASTITAYPGSFSGDIGPAGANIDIAECTEARTVPNFPVAGPGPDQVIKLENLVAGTRYFARVDSPGDLAIYILTDCANGTATKEQCLSYTDVGVGGIESASFIAPAGGVAYAVVDYYDAASLPDPTTYAFTIDTTGCFDDLDCAATTPLCNAGANQCLAPSNNCVGDDTTAEAASDDGPSGATTLTPITGTPSVTAANVCNDGTAPEADWYKIASAAPGDRLTASLAWVDVAADLDIYAFDAELNLLGQSYWENPETIALTFLPVGTTYLRVERFEPADSTAVTPYTLTVSRALPQLCTTAADCASEFRNQAFRASCTAGACQFLAGAGAVAQGSICDSDDDCTGDPAATICTSFLYTANLDTHGVCSSIGCTLDTDCAFLGAGGRCSTGMFQYCHVACTADNQCPSQLNSAPAAGNPWLFFTCTVATGHCDIN